MKRFLPIILVLSLILVFAGCGDDDSTTETTGEVKDVTMQMGYIHHWQWAPFYVAIEKGYFEEEGVNMTMIPGDNEDTVKLVAAGDAQLATATGEQLLAARGQGIPIVYIAEWYRDSPVVFFSLKEKGIATPEDLVGKTVGIPGPYGDGWAGWQALLYGSDINEEDVSVEFIGWTQMQAIQSDQVDSAQGYAINEPMALEAMGNEVNQIMVGDYFNFWSNGLFTSEQLIEEDPELVQGMVNGFLKGLQFTIDNPEEALDISLEYVPEAGGENREASLAGLMAAIDLWQTDQLGSIDTDKASDTLQFMMDAGILTEEIDLDESYTSEFVE
jgi:NitT/TauT family transport system substrate-binding protein